MRRGAFPVLLVLSVSVGCATPAPRLGPYWLDAVEPVEAFRRVVKTADRAGVDAVRRLLHATIDAVALRVGDVDARSGVSARPLPGAAPSWADVTFEAWLVARSYEELWLEESVLLGLIRTFCDGYAARCFRTDSWHQTELARRLRWLIERPAAMRAFLSDPHAATTSVMEPFARAWWWSGGTSEELARAIPPGSGHGTARLLAVVMTMESKTATGRLLAPFDDPKLLVPY